MKRINLVLCVFALFLVACKSKEEKANELIKTELYKTLYDFSSYEPIETIIDSAFTSIYKDSTIVDQAFTLQAAMNLGEEQLEEIRDAFSMIEIWEDSYSSYGRRKYYEYKDKIDDGLKKAHIYQELMENTSKEMKVKIDKFEPAFLGFQAKHKFRCKTKGGNYTLADYLYIIDKDFQTIISTTNLDDEDNLKIRNLIDEVKDSSREKKEDDDGSTLL